jgi:hypothetical protein
MISICVSWGKGGNGVGTAPFENVILYALKKMSNQLADLQDLHKI